MSKKLETNENSEETVDLGRRSALSRLGLAASAAYAAPVLMTLSQSAHAKGSSGGGDSGGNSGSGGGGSSHGGGDNSGSGGSTSGSEGSTSGSNGPTSGSNGSSDGSTDHFLSDGEDGASTT